MLNNVIRKKIKRELLPKIEKPNFFALISFGRNFVEILNVCHFPGTADMVNLAGVTYYRNLIKELRDNDIEPLVTLYHWDLPQVFQDQGGWPDEFIVDKFGDYARVCFEMFGSDVKYWLTFNEPKQTCLGGYAEGSKAPALQNPGIAEYQCTHNVLKSHAKAWHIYDQEFRATQNGKLSTKPLNKYLFGNRALEMCCV